MALDKMNTVGFKKKLASSCLVPNKTWEEIVNKPNYIDTFQAIVETMMSKASEYGEVTDKTPFATVKDIVLETIIEPMLANPPPTKPPMGQTPGTILVDAFWDEIQQASDYWGMEKKAFERILDMQERTTGNQPLDQKDNLQAVKEIINETIIRPLLGINVDE